MKEIGKTIWCLIMISGFVGFFFFIAYEASKGKPDKLENRDFAPPCEWCTN